MNTKVPLQEITGNKVYVSGTGVVCAAGNTTEEAFFNILKGQHNPKLEPELFQPVFKKPVFECDSSVLSSELLPKNRTLALIHKALSEALINAQLSIEMLQKYRVGICIGTTVACTLNDIDFYAALRHFNPSSQETVERYLCGDLSFVVADLFELKQSLTLSVANACSSGTNAINIAYSWLKAGLCDIAIAGGADELNEIPYCGFNSLQVMSDEFCLPFDVNRKGLNLGEGAGVIILEREEIILEREFNAQVILKAVAETSDAYHITGPHPEGRGLQLALNKLFDYSKTSPDNTAYINAHGTATINNDKTEAYVFEKVFKRQVPYSSTKYYTGHTLAAAGAIEAVFCIKGIINSEFPGLSAITPDPDIAVPPSEANIKYNGGNVISTSMAFGGSCAAIMFEYAPLFKNKVIREKDIYIKASFPCKFNIQKRAKSIINTIMSPTNIKSVKGIKCVSTGIVSHAGLGMQAFTDMFNLKKTHKPMKYGNIQALTIPPEVFKIPELKKMRRRADRLSMSMYLSAKEAIDNFGIEKCKKPALLVLSSFGAYVTTFRFLDGLLDFGFDTPSPTQFSNSVHNAPAFYISSQLNITGPALSINGFNNSFSQALNLASAYLQETNSDYILLVNGDEVSIEFLKILDIWNNSNDINSCKFPLKWAEYSSAFLLQRDDAELQLPQKELIEEVNSIFGFSVMKDSLSMIASLINSKLKKLSKNYDKKA